MTPERRPHPRPDAASHRRARVNLVNLTTPLGAAVARLGGARLRRGPQRLWLAEGYRLRFPVAGAFTVGDVVITAGTFDALERRVPGVLGHEAAHAAQYARWGVGFLPLYGLAAGWSWLRYRDHALGNAFERHAGLETGGYLAPGRAAPHALPWAVAFGLVRPSRGSAGGGPSDPPAAGPATGGAA